MLADVYKMNHEQTWAMALLQKAGGGDQMRSWLVAEKNDRTRQVARARARAIEAASVALIDWNTAGKRHAIQAVASAAMAEATSDLLDENDYMELVTPWRMGWLE